MKNLLIVLPFLCFITSCKNNDEQQLRDLLKTVAKGEHPKFLAGFNKEAMKSIHTKQFMQRGELIYDIRVGDAPHPIGNNSCDFHAFIAEAPGVSPFIGVRMQHQPDGWYIIGWWTP